MMMKHDVDDMQPSTSSGTSTDRKITVSLLSLLQRSNNIYSTTYTLTGLGVKRIDSNIKERKGYRLNHGEQQYKLGLCEICAFNDAKYTCPRCHVKSCSLACNKVHKLEVECDGQRDRTKFIPLNKYTNMDLSSDYRLLEEVARCLESSKKKFGRRWNDMPHGLFKLQDAAKSRKVELKFLPFKFARRRNNTTTYVAKSNTIYWHVEWIFINADNLRISTAKVPEGEKLTSTLNKYITSENNPLKENIQYYQSVGFAGLKFFLKAEQKIGKKFYELDPSLCLGKCLEKKLIIEYPTIHVILKDHGYEYNVIDTDDENKDIGQRVESGNDVVKTIIRNANSDENIYESLKNLLFISEYSDEEPSSDD